MAIWRPSVLSGHVVGSTLQTLLGVVVIVPVALLVGFRPDASPLDWLALAGFVTVVAFTFTWLCVALGLSSKSVETASNTPMFLILLPFLSSAFVPTGSMPGPVRFFAEHQPFTPITETIRGLLLGTPIGSSAVVSLAWCAAILAVGYVASVRLFNRPPRTA
jgi:ABC-2 type transport system permease protein